MQQNVTSKQLKAIYMLIEGKTAGEIAAALRLRRQTLWRWKQLPHFQHKFRQLMHDTEEAMQRRLGRLMDDSIKAVSAGLGYYGCNPKRVEVALKVIEKLGMGYENTAKMTKRTDNAKKEP